MRLTWSTIVLIIFIVIFSIFVANVANLINIDGNFSTRHSGGTKQPSTWQQNRKRLKFDDGADHLMWFLQISDIHISIFGDEERIGEFQEFATTTVRTIAPSVVLASGDLTDAKDRDNLGSRQYKAEWQIYHRIIEDSGVLNKTQWLDIRGNHDNFNVPGDRSAQNFFQQYSVQGGAHKRSYMKQIQKGDEKYTFIAVDACLEPGPKRPFNFIGFLSQNDTAHIVSLAEQARRSGGNYTIWFGHYPTSCIVSVDAGSWGLRQLIGEYEEGIAYLCGHLHKLAGMVPRMYTLQRDGFLELELGDWKTNRTYRLAVIDSGSFSFVDAFHNKWPVALITNPKHILYHIPGKEDPNLQIDSTHIRVLAFSPAGIANCTVRIDGGPWKMCRSATMNLFVAPWHPKWYKTGIHQIEVIVFDRRGKSTVIRQPFSLDGSRISFDLLARLILMSDASIIFRTLFGIALSMCVVPLFIFRGWHFLVSIGKLTRPRVSCRFPNSYIRRFWILSTIDRVMLPVVGYCLYLTVGPWSIGEVIDGHLGVIFSWGIYIKGGYLPGSLTYLYGFFQLTLCQLPLIWIFARCVENRYLGFVGRPTITEKSRGKLSFCTEHAPFVIIITIEIVLAVFFWQAYGTMAFLLGPFRTWSVLLNVSMWHIARNIPDKCLSSAAQVWRSS